MSAPFRLGLIGGGRMGRTHLRALEGSAEVTVVAVAEPLEASAAQLREQGRACPFVERAAVLAVVLFETGDGA